MAHLIQVEGTSAKSLNAVPVRVSAPYSYRAIGPSSRIADFGGHPYFVSLVAFLGRPSAVMLHAERVEDGSGASNYEALPAADWPNASYRIRSFCVTIKDQEIEGEHDLEFLRDAGWNPAGTLAMNQYLRTTDDHNEEVVISILVRGVDCSKGTEVRAALEEARRQVIVN